MVKNTVGKWMWYTNNIKQALGRLLTPEECRMLLLTKYTKGVSWENALKELK